MKLRDILLLVLLAAVWGFNFVPIRTGLNHMPPMSFTALRFLVTIFPVIFFVKRPKMPLWKLAVYGLVMFAGQFGFAFSGMYAGLAPGLVSLVMQMQAFFTMGLAALFYREKPLLFQVIGALVAASGIVLVGFHVGGEVTILGLVFILAAAMCWSVGNLMTKSFGKIDMLGVIVWGNMFAAIALSVVAVMVDGLDSIQHSVADLQVSTVLSVFYIAYGATYVGYSIWSHMLAHYPAAMVVPFTLLVPAFAMLSAYMFLGEAYPLWKFEATVLILCGLVLNQFGGKIVQRLNRYFWPTES